MARPRRSSFSFELFAERLGEVVADRLAPLLERALQVRGGKGRRGRPNPRKGRKLDMRCRYAGCSNRSKGPRFHFLCDEHLKLPRAQQKAALEKWEAKNA